MFVFFCHLGVHHPPSLVCWWFVLWGSCFPFLCSLSTSILENTDTHLADVLKSCMKHWEPAQGFTKQNFSCQTSNWNARCNCRCWPMVGSRLCLLQGPQNWLLIKLIQVSIQASVEGVLCFAEIWGDTIPKNSQLAPSTMMVGRCTFLYTNSSPFFRGHSFISEGLFLMIKLSLREIIWKWWLGGWGAIVSSQLNVIPRQRVEKLVPGRQASGKLSLSRLWSGEVSWSIWGIICWYMIHEICWYMI